MNLHFDGNPNDLSIGDAMAHLEQQRDEITRKLLHLEDLCDYLRPPIKRVEIVTNIADTAAATDAEPEAAPSPDAEYRIAEKRKVPAGGPLKSYDSLHGVEHVRSDGAVRAGFVARKGSKWFALNTRGSKMGQGASRIEALSYFTN